ncbi:MAG: ATP-binding protein, partial [Gemmatimonadetes bacterium]|nr:ATP-binding protein [Gemmatimonadota bacterium]
MLIEQTFTQLRELRLTGMADALEEQQAMPDVKSLSFEDRLGLLVEREATVRQDRRLSRLLGQAKLRLPATIEGLDLRSPRGLDRSVILRLAGCDWIRNHQVVLITGATGTGKTYLACALAQAACRQG